VSIVLPPGADTIAARRWRRSPRIRGWIPFESAQQFFTTPVMCRIGVAMTMIIIQIGSSAANLNARSCPLH